MLFYYQIIIKYYIFFFFITYTLLCQIDNGILFFLRIFWEFFNKISKDAGVSYFALVLLAFQQFLERTIFQHYENHYV